MAPLVFRSRRVTVHADLAFLLFFCLFFSLFSFLDLSELKELALEVSTDPDHKFDLAIQLDDLETALDLARSSPDVGSEPKWKTVGDKALAAWKIDLAEECFKKASDFGALLLIYTSIGDREGTEWLAKTARTSLASTFDPSCLLARSLVVPVDILPFLPSCVPKSPRVCTISPLPPTFSSATSLLASSSSSPPTEFLKPPSSREPTPPRRRRPS